MGRYLVSRLGSGLITLLVFLTALFFMVNWMVPGDFVTSLGPMTGADGAALRDQLGIDRPLHLQYLGWLGSLVTLDLGVGFDGSPVWETLSEAMASTLVVLAIGLSVAFVVGGWLGRVAGYSRSSALSGTMTFAAILFLTLFPPALAVGMERGVQRFAGWSGLGHLAELKDENWFGFDANLTVPQVLWRVFFVLALTALVLWVAETVLWRMARRRLSKWFFLGGMVGIPLVAWSRLGLTDRVIDLAGAMSLLLIAVVVLIFGEVLLVTRASMDDVMLEDYVMVARAKGLPERLVRDRHAARTALLPVLSRFTVAIPYFLTGLVILEVVFAGSHLAGGIPIIGVLRRFGAPPGLGTILFTAVADQNTPIILGALVVVGTLTLALRLALDVVHAALDPRIRFGGAVDA